MALIGCTSCINLQSSLHKENNRFQYRSNSDHNGNTEYKPHQNARVNNACYTDDRRRDHRAGFNSRERSAFNLNQARFRKLCYLSCRYSHKHSHLATIEQTRVRKPLRTSPSAAGESIQTLNCCGSAKIKVRKRVYKNVKLDAVGLQTTWSLHPAQIRMIRPIKERS